MHIGPTEIVLVLLLFLLLFGAKKLPELAKSMGKALKEFKKGASDLTNDMPEMDEPEPKKVKKRKKK